MFANLKDRTYNWENVNSLKLNEFPNKYSSLNKFRRQMLSSK